MKAQKNPGRLSQMITRNVARVHHKLLQQRAKALNRQLHAEVLSIDQEEFQRFESVFRQCTQQRGYEPDYQREFWGHRYRLYLSLEWLKPAIAALDANKAEQSLQGLEMGGITVVTDFLTHTFPQVTWQNTKGDLRDAWEYPDQSIDIIASMEVLEHVSDLPDGINDNFSGNGVAAILRQSYRVLKPGGILFITTPNAGSVYTLIRALAGEPPWLYPYHVREYTLKEIRTFLEEAGFKIRRTQAVHCLSIDKKIDYTVLFQTLLGSLIYQNFQDRGDDLFIMAEK